MRAALERFARRAWSGSGGLVADAAAAAALPLSWCFGSAVAARNRRFDRSPAERVAGLDVVSIGNLAVGGTGKTPLARWVVSELLGMGRTPAVVTRGFADEVALHRRWHPEVGVHAAPDRLEGVRRAQATGADSVVLDDAFQHRRAHRDLDVVLLAAEDPFPGPLLPAGPYREPPSALARAAVIVVTRRTATAAEAGRIARLAAGYAPAARVDVARLAPGGWQTLAGEAADAPEGDVLVAAGVARPEQFRDAVRGLVEGRVGLLALADHHAYSRSDVRRLSRLAAGRTLVVTEKDAVKLVLAAEELGHARVLGQEVRWEAGEALRAALGRLGGSS